MHEIMSGGRAKPLGDEQNVRGAGLILVLTPVAAWRRRGRGLSQKRYQVREETGEWRAGSPFATVSNASINFFL